MQFKNTYQNFGIVAKLLHGLIAITAIAMLSVGFFMSDFNNGTIYVIHKFTGLLLLCLVLLLVIWKSFNPKPAYPVTLSRLEQILAIAVQHSLLLLMVLMPMAGWLFTTAAGKPPQIGHWALPLPGVPLSPLLVRIGKTIHYYCAWLLIVFISIHSLAAFKHWFFNKDGIMQRMWWFND